MPQTRVRLRPVTEDDLPRWVEWINDPEVTRFTELEAGTATLEGEREWFRAVTSAEHRGRNWQIEAEGRHIGGCSLDPDAAGRTAVFGIIIGDKTAWNQGFGGAAVREVLRLGFTEMGLHRIRLEVFAENARAIRCYEKCGFRREGYHRKARFKRGEWEDVVSMAILREEWEAQEGVWTPSLQPDISHPLIRSYRPSDHAAVMALWEECGWEPGLNDTEEMLQQRAADPRGFIVLVEKDGALLGTVMGHMDRGWGWIQRLAVYPEHRRQGIGRSLTREAEKRLKALGAHRIVLLTRRDNPAAVGLYQSLDYETWEPVVVMSKRLVPGGEGNG